ncbi:ribosome maturation factor RimM [Nocardioides caldifontis]|uniref:ribosome maturation factor RimM n=1 Tax=Nocardioides caldifontis TaxID=2588938 RepID=UPI001EF07B39|nr:ribosome maturation factor RimM [Nocardioides caldifontis]
MVGRVGRPHGVRGEVSVEPRTDEPDRRFADGARLALRPPRQGAAPAYSHLTVRSTRTHQDRLLVTFEELPDRPAAEALRGCLLLATVSAEERPDDPEEFYDHQLVGLDVVTTDGRAVGTLAEVLHHGAQDLLVVRRSGHEDALVPFVTALVPQVDLDGGRVVVADRPGLLEPLEDDEGER